MTAQSRRGAELGLAACGEPRASGGPVPWPVPAYINAQLLLPLGFRLINRHLATAHRPQATPPALALRDSTCRPGAGSACAGPRMAEGGLAAAAEGGGRAREDYGGGVTVPVAVTCLMAASCGLIFGYDIGVSGGVTQMESFLRKFFPEVSSRMRSAAGAGHDAYCRYDDQLLTAFTSSLYIAAMLSSLVASRVTRTAGRQAVMLAGGVLFLAGSAINAGAANVAMLIVGRMLLGFGVGFTTQVGAARKEPTLQRPSNILAQYVNRAHRTLGMSAATGCTFVPRRDVAGAVARRVHHGVPHLPRAGIAGRHRHQLPHQPHPRVGLARVARPRRRARGRRRPGRPARPGHPQQPGPARRGRRGARLAAAPPRPGRGHRGRVQGHRPRRRGGPPERRGRVREAARRGVPALPGDGGGHPLLLRPHRRDCPDRLLAGAVPDGRVQQPEGHPRVRDPQPRELDRVVPVLRRHGPSRPQVLVPHRRRSDDRLPAGDGVDPGGPSREAGRGGHAARLRAGRADAHVPVHAELRRVVGPAQVGGAQRDLPRGDPVGGAGPDGVHRALPLLRADAGVRLPALRHEVRHLPVLRRLGRGDDGLRRRVPAGDQGRAAGGHARRLGAPLVLEEVRRRRGRQAGGAGELPVGETNECDRSNNRTCPWAKILKWSLRPSNM
ncbi:uncharacterized protein LOC120642259 isoform X2 [Panicum virgatum]|uniref:uncharacterized protein LOC120642259 isoform X2 n=1 Tax=Panicum virgatum TaxID=38727 RepID=UPI0019D68C28|nr:uncharacterized protein LOC120642259 isoform X2 [Panicum virgatum]